MSVAASGDSSSSFSFVVYSTKFEVPLLVSLTGERAIYLALELDRTWTEIWFPACQGTIDKA